MASNTQAIVLVDTLLYFSTVTVPSTFNLHFFDRSATTAAGKLVSLLRQSSNLFSFFSCPISAGTLVS